MITLGITIIITLVAVIIKCKEEKEKADAVMKKVEELWAKDAVDALWKRNVDNREREKENGN